MLEILKNPFFNLLFLHVIIIFCMKKDSKYLLLVTKYDVTYALTFKDDEFNALLCKYLYFSSKRYKIKSYKISHDSDNIILTPATLQFLCFMDCKQ